MKRSEGKGKTREGRKRKFGEGRVRREKGKDLVLGRWGKG